mmetsp:Transcript_5100/g.6663  ORF Transcript_5100/g.6663 Transcript_5100/m.6663 type:complete len:240 (+) Transcript_5100:292-1011(+)|eukprot:CAMPEP_0198145126 /NCGR_PEP_ID=MMETSP1443-20131203/21093_1 /TAXON_ID=186043 /ORGANISM="Entomoneis sp., Strain CCMP2396" /LENGTH=239 /DNA_ID=CAMNT_0043808657 /DNA_START=277 /DNA_END=996 /DNA_ORIENTATION=+
MKAKEMKVLRKKVEKADRVANPLESLVDSEHCNYTLRAGAGQAGKYRLESSSLSPASGDQNLVLRWCNSWRAIEPGHLFSDMMDLFEENMGELYKASSWGLDLEAKKEEFEHRKARFLIVTTSSAGASDTSEEKLVGFCHYRFNYDDDEYPSCVALYLYEIQVSSTFQSKSIGQFLMQVLNQIAQQASMSKVMLTVFKANQRAMGFYTQKLQYKIDATSPSQTKHYADYEILSKVLEPK